MSVIISINKVNKTFSNGEHAVKDFSLDILSGEIIALLGPNGAGKTTLISMICGIVSPTSGNVEVNGLDVVRDYRKTRKITSARNTNNVNRVANDLFHLRSSNLSTTGSRK